MLNVAVFLFQYGTLRMVGFDVLQPHVSYGTKLVDNDIRELYIRKWKCRLEKMFTEEPLSFPKLSDFNHETMTLNEKSVVGKVLSHHLMQ